jgi:uncharacterized membrane protein YobD (UPF0266 family)
MTGTGTKSAPGPEQKISLYKTLSQLALILTPTGIIALFCQLFDVSPQATGAVSLASVFVIGICIYRQFINRYIPSSLLTALLVGLGVVFFLNYQHILIKKTGLVRYYKQSNDYLAEIDKQINRTQQEIWFVGLDFNISATQRRDLLLSKLENGVKIRYLVFNPRSNRVGDLAKDFDQSESALRTESEKGLQNLLDLRKHWLEKSSASAHPGEIEIRMFEASPHFRLYVFDPGQSNGRTYLVPYANTVSSTILPGYLLENIDTGMYKPYFDSVRKLWTNSVTLDDFLKSHPDVRP